MGLFDFWKKPEPDLLPDIKRVPTDPAFAEIIAEYKKRRGSEKYAWCFEGGGSKGRYSAGVAAFMAQIGLLDVVDIMGGTSVGGLLTVIICRYKDESKDLQKVVDIWRGIRKNSDVYKGKIPESIWDLIKVLPGGLNRDGLLDNGPLRDLCYKHLGDYRQFSIPAYVTVTDYVTKKCLIWGPGTLAADMAIGTSSVPGAFRAHKCDIAPGGVMDGGCMMNNPEPFLLEQGVTKMTVFYCDPDPSKQPVQADAPNMINTLKAALAALFNTQEMRIYDDLQQTQELRRLKGLDPIEIDPYYPSIPTGDMLNFETNHNLLQQGYDDAVKYCTPDKLRQFLLS